MIRPAATAQKTADAASQAARPNENRISLPLPCRASANQNDGQYAQQNKDDRREDGLPERGQIDEGDDQSNQCGVHGQKQRDETGLG